MMLRGNLRILCKKAPQSAEVVVVGGGVVGASIAYQLARRGITNVVLLEPNALPTGLACSVNPASGGHKALAELAQYTRRFYNEAGSSIGSKTGSMVVARSNAQWEQIRHNALMHEFFGHDFQIIDAATVRGLNPLINPEGIRGGYYIPEDGTVDPAAAYEYLISLAKNNGVQVVKNLAVSGVERSATKIDSLITEQGKIQCEKLVLACGMESRKIVEMLYGRDVLPLSTVPHQYYVYDNVQGASANLPYVHDVDNNAFIRAAGAQLIVGTTGENGDQTPQNVIDSVPGVTSAKLNQVVQQLEARTPDNTPAMGRLAMLENAYVATGFNSQALSYAPGAGLAMAEWMYDGYPQSFQYHFIHTDVLRFHVSEEAKLTTGKVRTLPSADLHEGQGAVWMEAFDWRRPLYFKTPAVDQKVAAAPALSGVQKPATRQFGHADMRSQEIFLSEQVETLAGRNDVVVYDMTAFSKFMVTGPDSKALLNYVCTADMNKPDGSLIYTCLTNKNGGIVADFTVGKINDNAWYMICLSNQPHVILDHLLLNQPAFPDCKIEETTRQLGTFAIAGPRSQEVVQSLSVDDIDFPPFTMKEVTLKIKGKEIPNVWLARVSFTGDLGWEIHAPIGEIPDIHQALIDAGVAAGGVNSLMNCARVEKKFIHLGHEFGPLDTPNDVGYGWCCKTKSDIDFQGKTGMINTKTTKQLVTMTIPTHDTDEYNLWVTGGDLILRNGKTVGYTTTSCYSHCTDQPMAIALIEKFKIDNENDKYELKFMSPDGVFGTVPIKLTKQALVDPKMERVKGIFNEKLDGTRRTA